MQPAAILSLLVKTEGASVAAAELKKFDRTAAATDKSLARSGASAKRHSRAIDGVTTAAKYGSAALVGGLVVGLTKSISAFQDSERVSKQTTAVLKSTGGQANVTKKHVEDLATAISRKTGIDDEAIQSSENLLLTFTKVRDEAGKGNDIFTQATKTVQDMSIALGQDGKSSAIQLGKALNDPIKGVSALQRVGVSFTAKQKDQIKTLVEHGDKLKAQKIILHELNTEFGGSAAAAGNTFSGSLQKAKTAVGNLGETIGGALAPKVKDVADKLTVFVNQMQDGTGAGGRFVDKMKSLADGLGKVLGVVKDVGSFLGKHPALLVAAGSAWVAYQTAAVAQIAIVKAAELGLFGANMRAKLATSAGGTGTTVGKTFATKAGLAAAAGVAGWEFGSWLRKHVGPARAAGDFIGTQLGQAIFGGSKLQDFADAYRAKLDDIFTSFKSAVNTAFGKAQAALDKAAADAGVPNTKVPGIPRGDNKPPRKPPKIIRTASVKAGAAAMNVMARMSGEAGGAELGSLQSALAWVKQNYGSSLRWTAIENAGGSNQHLHIGAPPATVVAIGKALQAMGFAVGENPSFGGVHPVHTPGSDHYSAMAIDVNSDFKSIRAAGQSVKDSTQKLAAKVTAQAKKIKEKIPVFNVPGWEQWDSAQWNFMQASLHPDWTRKQAAQFSRSQIDRTIDNPWLQAALTHTDNMVGAGKLSQAQGDALKTGYLTNAIPGLAGDNKLIAQGMVEAMKSVPEAFRDVLDRDVSNIGLRVRAGDLTDAQGIQQQIDLIRGNLGNPGLTEQDRLEERAALGDLAKALQDNTDVTQDNTDLTQALLDQNKAIHAELKRSNDISESITAISGREAIRSWADALSGQIAGPMNYGGRRLTAGSGKVSRS